MLLGFTDRIKKHLTFLCSCEDEVLAEFCRISIEFIRNGINTKVYHSAAGKLGVEADDVKHGVEALMYLFVESSRVKLSEVDFHDSIMMLGFKEESRHQLHSVYTENRELIRQTLSQLSSTEVPQYRELEWRFDVQVASRCLREQIEPQVMLKLHLDGGQGAMDTKVLQTDPTNLLHITQGLEEALKELNTSHARRIIRNL